MPIKPLDLAAEKYHLRRIDCEFLNSRFRGNDYRYGLTIPFLRMMFAYSAASLVAITTYAFFARS